MCFRLHNKIGRYRHEKLTPETRDAFLLQVGLKLTLMESPAVSGSLTYKQLCVAAKQEEKRLIEAKATSREAS